MNVGLLESLLSQLWLRFLLVGVFAFLSGLEFREYLSSKTRPLSFGTARTYTYIGLLGFVFAVLDPTFRLYLGGMVALIVWTGIFYHRKLAQGQTGILGILIGILVYTFGPVIQVLPAWFLVLEFVGIVFVLNARPLTHRLTETIDRRELMTLAKFLLLAAVILPLMPDEALIPFLPSTPFWIWVAVVAISAISYLGYVLQRYVFPHQGYLLTGLLGGLYSSTATTVVLGHKIREQPTAAAGLNVAILAASGTMYLRLLVLIAILNPDFLRPALPPFLLLGLGTIGYCVLHVRKKETANPAKAETVGHNPLELGTAFLFAAIFVAMLFLSQAALHYFGNTGLQVLSFIVGFTDIDPFVLSLLEGHFPTASLNQLAIAIVIAAGSNNFLKALYAVLVSNWRQARHAVLGLLVLGALNLLYAAWMTQHFAGS